MKLTNSILAAVVVVVATLSSGAEGLPRPQEGNSDAPIFMVDGFAFDGPADRTRPSIRPGLLRGTSTAAPTSPTPVVAPTPAPTTQSPDVARCTQNCQFQVTSEYNPVCGSDGVMYTNSGLLNCASNCGANVTLLYPGRCQTANIRG